MSVDISKGGVVDLNKEAGGSLTAVKVGLGWDPRTTAGQAFDLDAVAFVVGKDGRVLDERWFVFYKNLQSPDKSVVHFGDNLTGDGEGDDEVIGVNLAGLPAAADRVVFGVSIYDANRRKQKFGDVSGSYIRILNSEDETELGRYDLRDEFALETAAVFGELYRDGRDWFFRAIGKGDTAGLAGLCYTYGINTTGG